MKVDLPWDKALHALTLLTTSAACGAIRGYFLIPSISLPPPSLSPSLSLSPPPLFSLSHPPPLPPPPYPILHTEPGQQVGEGQEGGGADHGPALRTVPLSFIPC